MHYGPPTQILGVMPCLPCSAPVGLILVGQVVINQEIGDWSMQLYCMCTCRTGRWRPCWAIVRRSAWNSLDRQNASEPVLTCPGRHTAVCTSTPRCHGRRRPSDAVPPFSGAVWRRPVPPPRFYVAASPCLIVRGIRTSSDTATVTIHMSGKYINPWMIAVWGW